MALASLVAALGAAAFGGCLYDSSDRCGDHMHYDEALRVCVCDQDAIAVASGCTACAADEVVVSNACVCPAGQAKNASDVCVAP